MLFCYIRTFFFFFMVIRESIDASVYSYKVIEFVLDNLKDKKDGKPKTIIEWEKNNE